MPIAELPSAPSKNQVRAGHLSGLTRVFEALGGRPEAVLEASGLSVASLRNPESHLSVRTVVEALEYCSASLDDELFGLQLAHHQNPNIFGCVGLLCRSAPSVKASLEAVARYFPVFHAPDGSFELLEGQGAAEFRWGVRTDIGDRNQAYLQSTLLNLKIIRAAAGPDFKPRYVSFGGHIAPRHVGRVEDWLGCRLYSNAPVYGIGFSVDYLVRPGAAADSLSHRFMQGYLEHLGRQRYAAPIEQLNSHIRIALPSGNCSIERCARSLGYASARSLQAVLEGYKTTFTELVEQQRRELALSWLHGDMPLEEVALRLGYSQQSAFGRAFKRWVGISPNMFRRRATRTMVASRGASPAHLLTAYRPPKQN
jgi:AraC-like DNA-binding protein